MQFLPVDQTPRQTPGQTPRQTPRQTPYGDWFLSHYFLLTGITCRKGGFFLGSNVTGVDTESYTGCDPINVRESLGCYCKFRCPDKHPESIQRAVTHARFGIEITRSQNTVVTVVTAIFSSRSIDKFCRDKQSPSGGPVWA